MKPARVALVVVLIPHQAGIGAVLGENEFRSALLVPFPGIIRIIEPEKERCFILVRQIPPDNSRIFQHCIRRDPDHVIHLNTFVFQPFGSDLPGGQRYPSLFEMKVALGVDIDPFAIPVGPDLGSAVMFAAKALGPVVAVQPKLACLPAEGLRAFDVSNRIVGTPEFLALCGVLENLGSVACLYSRCAVGYPGVHPVFQYQLGLPLIPGPCDHTCEIVALP